MKTRQVKIHDSAGVAHYETFVDFEGIVEIARAGYSEDPTNEKCAALIHWYDSLDHKPAYEECVAFLEAHGVIFENVEAEDFQN